MKANILLTGKPGCGKSSLIAQLIRGQEVGGIITPEVRRAGVRIGFRVVDLHSKKAALFAKVGWSGPKISKYGIDVAKFERIAIPALSWAIDHAQIVVIDEIGKMEWFSEPFRAAVVRALDARKVLGTISLKDFDPQITAIKRRPDVKLFVLTRENREKVREEILNFLS